MYCLDVLGGNQGNNATVDLAPCNNTAAQLWWPAGFSAVFTNYEHMNVNAVSGSYQVGCLDVSNDNIHGRFVHG